MAVEKVKLIGSLMQQRNAAESPKYFIFQVKAKELIKWSGFKRATDFAEGTQRTYRESRLNAIAKFLKADNKNTIPNNILIAFDQNNQGKATFTPLTCENEVVNSGEDFDNGVQLSLGYIEFDFDASLNEGTEEEVERKSHQKPALVIDGQHRLLGMVRHDEDVSVLVIGILDCTPTEQAFQFIVINNKAVRVPTPNVKGMISDITLIEDDLNDRLLKAGVPFGKKSPLLHEIDNDEDSPFNKLLDWTSNREGKKLIPLTAIEQCLSLYKNTFKKVRDDEDSQRVLLYAVWNAVKSKYPELWGEEDNYLMKKVSLNAINEFLIERLKFLQEYKLVDIFDPEDVENKVKELIDQVPKEFWVTEWTIAEGTGEKKMKVQDNANVRALIKKDLDQIIANEEEATWFDKLKLIRPSSF